MFLSRPLYSPTSSSLGDIFLHLHFLGFISYTLERQEHGTRHPCILLPLVPIAAGTRPMVNLRAKDFDDGNSRWISVMETIETAWFAGPEQPPSLAEKGRLTSYISL
jgi:hypothetical protein